MSNTTTPTKLHESKSVATVGLLIAALDPVLAEIRALRARDAEHLAGLLQRLDKHHQRAESADQVLDDLTRRLEALEALARR